MANRFASRVQGVTHQGNAIRTHCRQPAIGENPLFKLLTPDIPLGVQALDPVLNINGNSIEPVFRYNGKDAGATWSPWGYGEDLTLQAGSPTYNAGSPCMGDLDDSVKGDGTAYWQASNSSFADIGTEDFVIEAIVKPSSASENIIGKWGDDGSGNNGWRLHHSSTGNLILYVYNNGSYTFVAISVQSFAWCHVILTIDRDQTSLNNGVLFYLNGVYGSRGTIDGYQGSLSNSTGFVLAATPSATVPLQGNIAYLALWKQSDLFPGGATNRTIMDAIAEERHLRLQGLWPKCKGTPAPTTWGRAYAAYTWKHDGTRRRYFLVGSNWMRLARDLDANGELVTGYLGEPQITNEVTDSEDYTAASWTLENGTDSISSDATTSPDPDRGADGIIADTTDTQHGVTTSFTAASDGTYCFWVIAKAGAKTWLCLENETLTDGKVYYDLANIALGTAGADITDKNIWDLGDGWRLCWLTYSGVATMAYSLTVRFADGDLDDVYAGDGTTISGYLWVAQNEFTRFPTSPIITSGAAATRLVDNLEYNGDNARAPRGTLAFDLLMRQYAGSDTPVLASLNDGTTTNYLELRRTAAALAGYAVSDGVSQTTLNGTVDIDDNEKHAARMTWKDSDRRIYTDDGDEQQDAAYTVLSSITKIGIGQRYSAQAAAGAIITNIRIFGRPTRKG